MLNFSIGFSGMETDIEKEEARFYAELPYALQNIGADMKHILKRHIDSEFYPLYSPRVYMRRKDYPQYGTPLDSEKYMDSLVERGKLTFTYEPHGDHSITDWHTRDGDELIRWAQEEHNNGEIPARPFWDNFVSEIKHNFFPSMLLYYMGKNHDIRLTGDDVTFENTDGALGD